MKKADVAEMMRDMPDEIDAQELIYRLYLKSKIEEGEAAERAGDLVPHAEALKIIESWLK